MMTRWSWIQAAVTPRRVLVARSMPCLTASSKLCGEVEEISVTRATDMALPPDLSFCRAQTGWLHERLARARSPTSPTTRRLPRSSGMRNGRGRTVLLADGEADQE